MRKAILIGIASFTVLASRAGAQVPVQAATVADSALVEHNIYAAEFHNITLTPEQSATARQVIARTERATHAVPRSLSTPCERYARVARLVASRDSTLLALMTTLEDSARFRDNAAQFHMAACVPPKS
jgi:hypothetical protein